VAGNGSSHYQGILMDAGRRVPKIMARNAVRLTAGACDRMSIPMMSNAVVVLDGRRDSEQNQIGRTWDRKEANATT
jgi:hypothetical protein